MATLIVSTHGVMEGGGSYNLHAKVPAGGGSLALPYLEKAAQSCTLRSGSDPIVIADYGSSQGKNSLRPMRAAIRCLRARVGSDRPLMVIHIDQPANDFNTSSMYCTVIPNGTRWVIPMFFRLPSEDPSTRTLFR